jgi:hypothetical protein
MITEVNLAQRYLIDKFGGANNVPSGTYAIPVETSKGNGFMKVIITEDKGMSGFHLFKDEALTDSWYEY